MVDELTPPGEEGAEPEEPGQSTREGVGPRLVKRFMAEFRGGFAGGSLIDKLSTKQIDKLLDQTNLEGQRQHELDVQRNWMTFVLISLGVTQLNVGASL